MKKEISKESIQEKPIKNKKKNDKVEADVLDNNFINDIKASTKEARQNRGKKYKLNKDMKNNMYTEKFQLITNRIIELANAGECYISFTYNSGIGDINVNELDILCFRYFGFLVTVISTDPDRLYDILFISWEE